MVFFVKKYIYFFNICCIGTKENKEFVICKYISPLTEESYKKYIAQREIDKLMEFFLPKVDNVENMIQIAKLLI